jgi:prephenate dehydrogenase
MRPEMKPSHFPEVAIVGMGLIGGSLGLALRRRGVSVCGIDLRRASLRAVRFRKGAQWVTSSISEGVRRAKLVVLCVPIHEFGTCLAEINRHAPSAAVITDVTSVKRPVMEMASRILCDPGRFIGGHPMAGSEKAGFGAASPTLFQGCICILTPSARTKRAALRKVTAMWTACGARLAHMSPQQHDATTARTSHLPHAIAAILTRQVLGVKSRKSFVSGSFLDATRVALSSTELWERILLANRHEVSASIGEFACEMKHLGIMIGKGDKQGIARVLKEGKALRSSLSASRRKWMK